MVPVAAATAEPAARVSPKQAFLRSAGDRRTLASDLLAPPPAPHNLKAGSIIPAAMINVIRSVLPGQITAQVTDRMHAVGVQSGYVRFDFECSCDITQKK